MKQYIKQKKTLIYSLKTQLLHVFYVTRGPGPYTNNMKYELAKMWFTGTF